MMAFTADFAVVGAGVVGSSIAFGLLKHGYSVVLLDGSKTDPRASGANFGLVWVQGKGPGVPDYQFLTRVASDAWPEFAAELAEAAEDKSGSLAYERNGGLAFTFGEQGFFERKNQLLRLHNERGADGDDIEMIDRREVSKLLPDFELSEEVSGASFCWRDGCVNPLRMHALLLQAIENLGGRIVWNATVRTACDKTGTGWVLKTDAGDVVAGHVVAACGLGAKELGVHLGLEVPVRPQRGQVLVSKRMPKVMRLPASTLRQTADGTFLVGATKEEVDFDEGTSLDGARQLARNALRITPMLKNINVVRHWAGLRVMTPDGAPIYDFGNNASAAACHSGITLAPVHASLFVDRILGRSAESQLHAFDPSRFKKESVSQFSMEEQR
ncbi:MAG: FAD-binding oxidoreductase [Rhodobacteraceae bacterium]|nr:FAD-binding oxidoreductase [Paracoccaceae bacterium]